MKKFHEENIPDRFVLDMSETISIHSSFIGFLIDLKNRLKNSDKQLELRLSPYIESLLHKLDLYEHFIN